MTSTSAVDSLFFKKREKDKKIKMLNLLYFIVLCFVCVKTNNIGVIHSNLFKKFIDELSRELYFTFNSSSPPEWGGQDSNQRGDQTFPPGIQTGSSEAPIGPELSG